MRAAAGGFLFGIPLLYTMEVWWYGSWVDPRWMLGALALSLVVVIVLTRTSGFRNARDTTWRDAAFDGIVIVAIGVLCAAAILLVIREITLATSLEETIGKVVFEAIPFAVGAALARQFLSRREREEGEGGEDEGGGLAEEIGVDDPAIGRTLADAGAAAVGALVLCLGIAPTDEVPLIASAMTPPWLLALTAASLLISYAIVFEADFSDQAGRRRHEGPFQRPFAETVGAYVISLTVAGLALLFFQRIGPDQDWRTWLAWTVVLGLPATIGGAAGRLAV
jgi:putative integral membrane protein (TIGR02587 family)